MADITEADMAIAQRAWDDIFGHLPGNPPWVERLAQYFADYRMACSLPAQQKRVRALTPASSE